jgi:acetyltransferase-like isoleucine patch superfamily enzyme
VMRHWQSSPPGRWLASLRALAQGVRLHPTAALIGRRVQIVLGRGSSISRGCVLRADGDGRVTLGENVWLARDVEIETDTHVRLGARTTIQRRCSINGTARIGEGCIFAPDVFVSSGTHPFRHIPHLPIREQERRLIASGGSVDKPVWIQDDCWIGTHVTIAPGVTIGKGCVIGANSVVTKDVPPYSVAAGLPARVIGERLAWNPPARVDPRSEVDAPYVLSAGDSWLVALRESQGGEHVRVTYLARRTVNAKVNGEARQFSAGDGSIIVPTGQGLPFGASIAIDLSGDDAHEVDFTAFELVAPAP